MKNILILPMVHLMSVSAFLLLLVLRVSHLCNFSYQVSLIGDRGEQHASNAHGGVGLLFMLIVLHGRHVQLLVVQSLAYA